MAEKLVILEKRSNVPGVSTENPDHGTKSAFLKNPDAGKLPTFAEIFPKTPFPEIFPEIVRPCANGSCVTVDERGWIPRFEVTL